MPGKNILWFGLLNMSVIATIYYEKLVPLYNHRLVYIEWPGGSIQHINMTVHVYMTKEIQQKGQRIMQGTFQPCVFHSYSLRLLDIDNIFQIFCVLICGVVFGGSYLSQGNVKMWPVPLVTFTWHTYGRQRTGWAEW